MNSSVTKPSPVPRDAEADTEDAPRRESEKSERPDHNEAGRARRFARRVARPGVLLAVLLICALLAGAAILGIQVYKDDALRDAHHSAVRSAREYAVALTTYDHKTLKHDFDKVSNNATGEFAKEYKKVSANLTKLITKHKAVSKGNVLAAGLVNGDRNRAVVLLFVDQTITNTNISKPRIDRNRMRMTLLHKDGRWLIDNVELL